MAIPNGIFSADLFPGTDFSKINLDWICDELKKQQGEIDELRDTVIDYDDLTDKPSIEGVTLEGNKTLHQLNGVTIDDLNGLESWAGYPDNVFDATAFTTTNSTNWTLSDKTKTTITITHNNTYSTGFPRLVLNLPVGTYLFKADYSQSSLEFELQKNGKFEKVLYNGTIFSIEDGLTYEVVFFSTVADTYKFLDLSFTEIGKLNRLENEVDEISDYVSSEVGGTSIENRAINPDGTVVSAGSNRYAVTRYAVESGKQYLISGSTAYANLIWCFYDLADNVVEKGTAAASGGTFTNISNSKVTAPDGACVLRVAYHIAASPPYDVIAKCVVLQGLKSNPNWNGKKWTCVGDSLTEVNGTAKKKYFDYVSEMTGISVYNMGFSGCGYARGYDSGNAFYQKISYVPADSDVVTIFGSFNDLGAGLSLGTVTDNDTTTLAGCINETIDVLQSTIPLVNLGIVAPCPWNTTQPTTSGQAYDYVEMLKAICQHRSIPFLDLWRSSNLRPWDASFRTLAYSHDGGSGTHPDENGHKLLAPHFEAFIKTLLLY